MPDKNLLIEYFVANITERSDKVKIFLDDVREAPEDYVRCYWPDEVCEILAARQVDEISLDHDLGDDSRGTGYDVLLWIEEQVVLHDYKPPIMKVHSSNPPAVERMQRAINAINATWKLKNMHRL